MLDEFFLKDTIQKMQNEIAHLNGLVALSFDFKESKRIMRQLSLVQKTLTSLQQYKALPAKV